MREKNNERAKWGWSLVNQILYFLFRNMYIQNTLKDLNEYFINQDGGRFTLNGLATKNFIEIISETLSLRSRFVSVSYVGNVSQKCGCNNRWIWGT